MRIADHHQIVREIERELIVSAAELGMNDARAVHVGAGRQLSPDNDPPFDRRNEKRLIKARADNPQQRLARAWDVAELSRRRRCSENRGA